MILPLDVARCTGWLSWAQDRVCERRESCARFRQAVRDREAIVSGAMPARDFDARKLIDHCFVGGEPTSFIPEEGL
jgi:hypothetical protein